MRSPSCATRVFVRVNVTSTSETARRPHISICRHLRKLMKTQRVRRRKLRFGAAAKDVAAPIVTVVTVERASKHLTKRRKRQQRSRRAPARLISTARCTPHDRIDGTWSHIQEQFIAAKSLGDMYVVKTRRREEGTRSCVRLSVCVPAPETSCHFVARALCCGSSRSTRICRALRSPLSFHRVRSTR